MQKKVLIGAVVGCVSLLAVGCGGAAKPTKLTAEELGAANNAAVKYFQSKTAVVNGQQIKGASGGCSNIDSNNDSYVSCSGSVPTVVKDAQTGKVIDAQMVDATIQCGVSAAASGCKQ